TSGTGSGTGSHDIRSWEFINAYAPIDDFQVRVTASASGTQFPAGSDVLISGTAASRSAGSGVTREMTSVRVNGTEAEVLDPSGNFFTRVLVAPGQNRYDVVATDRGGKTATTALTLEGTPGRAGAVDLSLSDVSASFTAGYGRTSFD